MKLPLLALSALLCLGLASCIYVDRNRPGHDSHGPGNSGNAPGHNKK